MYVARDGDPIRSDVMVDFDYLFKRLQNEVQALVRLQDTTDRPVLVNKISEQGVTRAEGKRGLIPSSEKL